MLKKIITIIFILIAVNIWGEINTYEHELLKTFPVGSGNGEIGFNIKAMEGAGRVAPLSFSISKQIFFHIGDIVNKRIVIYNSNLTHNKNINWKSAGRISNKMIITESSDIIVSLSNRGIYVIYNDGKVRKIEEQFYNFNKLLLNNYFYFANYILYYDINCNLKAADTNGKIYENTELQAILNELNNTYAVKSWRNLEDNTLQLKVESFIQDKKINIIGNRILDNDYFTHKKYFEFFKNNTVLVTRNSESAPDLTDLPKLIDISLINYDAEDNSYWRYMTENRDFLIIVYNKYGELIDAFDTIDYALYDVAPNGDVYVLETHHEAVQANNGYNFYKITRRW